MSLIDCPAACAVVIGTPWEFPLTCAEAGATLRPDLSACDLKRCRMRKWLLLGLFAGLALASAAGCATVTKTSDENWANARSIMELDLREMGDDWNMLCLTDRQCRLTRWHTR